MNETIEETRRVPAQDRSKKRVESILTAAKGLIAEKGCARLKIHDIAERANVTPASIYQYFPNKNAITFALAEQTLKDSNPLNSMELPEIASKEDCYLLLQGLVEQFYQIYINDPALIDVWISISADKAVQDLDLEDSRRTGHLIFSCICTFYDKQYWPDIERICFLMSHIVGSVIRMAVSLGEEEGRTVIDQFKKMVGPELIESMLGESGH